MGREQFRMTVEAPLSRIEAELLPVLRATYAARVEPVQADEPRCATCGRPGHEALDLGSYGSVCPVNAGLLKG